MEDYFKQLNWRSMNTYTGADFGIVLAGKDPAICRALARIVFIRLQIPFNNFLITNYE